MWTFLFLLIALYFFFNLFSKSEATGNWGHLFPDMVQDPEEFYSLVEQILREHQVPEIRTERKTFKEGGILSHQRLYLEVARGDYMYHICAAPWGNGFFFSWWLRKKGGDLLIEKLPILGPIISNANQYDTYYKLDTDAMFRASVQQAVSMAIDQITKAKGIRELTELERKPDLRSLVK